MPREPGHAGDHDILPIFHVEERSAPELPKTIGFTGTGFRVNDDLLVTCWHCVPDADAAYTVAFPEPTGGYRMHALVDVSRDTNGRDLATARIFAPSLPQLLNLEVGPAIAAGGTDVFTWGYPLTEDVRLSPDDRTIHLNSRFLAGYVTRAM